MAGSAERFRRYACDPAGAAGYRIGLLFLPSIEGGCWGRGPNPPPRGRWGLMAGSAERFRRYACDPAGAAG